MLKLTLIILLAIATVATVPARADVGSLRTLLQSIITDQDESRLPPADRVQSEFAAIGNLSPDDVRSLLPLAEKCLVSAGRSLRDIGLGFFFDVAFRMDGSQLLAPYIDEIAHFLDDSREGTRNGVIWILGMSNPQPLPQGLRYLVPRLDDTGNTSAQFEMIAGALLKASPDSATVHKVLTAVGKRSDFRQIRSRFIEILAIAQARSEEAYAFISAGLADRSFGRMAAIEAIGQMPRDMIRSRFSQELQRVVADSDETQELRDRARQVLIK